MSDASQHELTFLVLLTRDDDDPATVRASVEGVPGFLTMDGDPEDALRCARLALQRMAESLRYDELLALAGGAGHPPRLRTGARLERISIRVPDPPELIRA